MARDDAQSSVAETRKEPAGSHRQRPLPPAWQPLTWRGVAAFAVARLNRLLIAQTVVALLTVAAVLWFLDTGWFPAIRDAISQLPETGAIENGQLVLPRPSPLPETRLLTMVVNLDSKARRNVLGDLRVEFRRETFGLCSFLGCWSWNYPLEKTIPFNQPDLQSHWGAWATMIHLCTALAVFMGLFASWFVLATIYAPMVRLFAFFKDRELTLAGSWKLVGAALLPGSLLVSGALVLYGLGFLDLPRFLAVWLLHFFVGWAYLLVSPRRLPAVADALPRAHRNPFGNPTAEPPSANPFERNKRSPANSP
jgi:hypothetical protein